MSQLPRPFGAYTLLRRLAVGGMAEIYVAKTRGLGGFEKLTALKLVHAHLSADAQFVRMLIDEAKILVLLTHANIAQVFDLGNVEDRYFIAMEYVDGVDLQGLARAADRLGSPLSVPLCCFVVAEMLNGLDYAHRKRDPSGRPLGIVHRDISPQNVVVSRAGEVKLVDFGIAKTNLRAERTEVGVIKGKYGYMSPEQAWADPTDKRSDVFSAGVLLYELLTTSTLYSAKSVAELIAKVRRAEIPPPRSLRKEIGEELSGIVMRALALEPSDRYQTALEMGDALREYLYKSGQAMSGARLGRDIVDMLEADEKLARESVRPDETGGLRALRREEFVRNDDSLIFRLPAEATRNEVITARPAARKGSSTGSISRKLSNELDDLLAMPLPNSRPPASASAPPPPPRGEVRALSVREPNNDTEPPTELWTQRWFAQQGTALEFNTDIRVNEVMPGEVPADSQITQRHTPLAQRAAELNSYAPPSLSWPPQEPPRPRRAPLPSPPALMPPRGEDPSLGPLPPEPLMPDFRGKMKRGFGARELGLIMLFLLLGALGAFVAWESAPASAIEIWTDPAGARVRIDDAWQAGSTPMRISGLRRGKTYRLRLEAPRYKPYDGQLTPTAPSGRERYKLEPR
ncbi:MAG TPA: serine/threonine-protein kinase [Polyangiales bacterium]|nr:serine/threonine-protein kinase [Polyangiales bacterium]